MLKNNLESINPYILHCGSVSRETCPPPGTDYNQRRVKWYEIELITWGEGRILTEGVPIPAVKGNIFFRSPGMTVQGFSPYYCYLVVFDISYDASKISAYKDHKSLMNDTTHNHAFKREGNFNGLNFPDVFRTQRFERFSQLFKGIYNEHVCQSKAAALYTKTLLLELITEAYDEYTSGASLVHARRSIQLNYPKITAAKEYIDNNPGMWFTLEDLANYTGLSRTFFCRIFKDIVGSTPVDYINTQKINAAKRLLIETNCSIKEVAYELGFENDTYFYSMFKGKTGLTPLDYRQKQRSAYQALL